MRRIRPDNPFLVVRGFDRAMAEELIKEYHAEYILSGDRVWEDRSIFVKNLLPFLAQGEGEDKGEGSNTDKVIKTKIQDMIVKKLPLTK